MKKVIILAAILAFVMSAAGYALSQSNKPGDKGSAYSRGSGGYGMMGSGMMGSGMMGSGMGSGMMGSGMMGSGMMGNQGGTPINPQTQQPYTEEEWNQAVEQMQATCGAMMSYNSGTDL